MAARAAEPRVCGLVGMAEASTPGKKRPGAGTDDAAFIPTLALVKFGEQPWVEFGDVAPGSTGVRQLHLTNPTDKAVTVCVERCPERKGFTVDATAEAFSVDADSTHTLTLAWAPREVGGVRETLRLKLNGRYPLSAVLFGSCVEETRGKGKGKSKSKGKMKGGKKRASSRGRTLGEASTNAPDAAPTSSAFLPEFTLVEATDKENGAAAPPAARPDSLVSAASALAKRSKLPTKAKAFTGKAATGKARAATKPLLSPRGENGATAGPRTRSRSASSDASASEEDANIVVLVPKPRVRKQRPVEESAGFGFGAAIVAREARSRPAAAAAAAEGDKAAADALDVENIAVAVDSLIAGADIETAGDEPAMAGVPAPIGGEAEAEAEATPSVAEAAPEPSVEAATEAVTTADQEKEDEAVEEAKPAARKAERMIFSMGGGAAASANNEAQPPRLSRRAPKGLKLTFSAPRHRRKDSAATDGSVSTSTSEGAASVYSSFSSSSTTKGPRAASGHSLSRTNAVEGGKQRARARASSKSRRASTGVIRASTGVAAAESAKLRRVLYDDRWAEKQEKGFTAWLQHVFVPPAEEAIGVTGAVEDQGHGHRRLMQARLEAAVRRKAFRLYHSPDMDDLMYAIDGEVAAGKLAVRTDRELHADLGMRDALVRMLMSYQPQWLRVGLETVFGEVIEIPSASAAASASSGAGAADAAVAADAADTPEAAADRARSVVRKFLLTRVLTDAGIAATYEKTKSGIHSKAHAAEQHRQTLRRFLRLVLFLDVAKQENLLGGHGNCLFDKSSPYKSSRAVIIAFAKDFLAGEGDVTRHLSLLGYTVTYEQTYLDEFDFGVNNLATDLRDGVRLCRLVEILASLVPMQLCKGSRVPAGSRLQKLHNVAIAMKALEEFGVHLDVNARGSAASASASASAAAASGPLSRGGRAGAIAIAARASKRGQITARDIVDGHREKTLALLWAAICHWRLPDLVHVADVEIEIAAVCAASRLAAAALKAVDDEAAADGATATAAAAGAGGGDDATGAKKDPVAVLLRWCQAVCGKYGIRIRNWTSSFADGRAMFFLVHHYHPTLLPRAQLSRTTTDLMAHSGGKTSGAPGASPDMEYAPRLKAGVSAGSYEAAVAGERRNFEEVSRVVASLGCVPAVLPVCDTTNIPEQRSLVVFVAYLCTRLLESSREARSSVTIQQVWRTAVARRRVMRHSAALKVVTRVFSRHVRDWLARRREARRVAVIDDARATIAAWVASLRARTEARVAAILAKGAAAHGALVVRRKGQTESHSAERVVTFARMAVARMRFVVARAAAVAIQSAFKGAWQRATGLDFYTARYGVMRLQAVARGAAAREALAQQFWASVAVQCAWRGHQGRVAAQRQRAARGVQAAFRGYRARVIVACQRFAGDVIVATVRASRDRRAFVAGRAAVVRVQAAHRGRVARAQYAGCVTAVTAIQAFARGCAARHHLAVMDAAATIIGAQYRCHVATSALATQRAAVVCVQTAFRCFAARVAFVETVAAVVAIQKHVRAFAARRACAEQHAAATAIRATYLAAAGRAAFAQQRAAAVTIQSFGRFVVAFNDFCLRRGCAVVIQAAFRGFAARHDMALCAEAATVIAACYKGHLQYTSFAVSRAAAVAVQANYRCHAARCSFATTRAAALAAQSVWRMYQAHSALMHARAAATTIAAAVRASQARRRFATAVGAALRIQSLFRGRTAANGFVAQRAAATAIKAAFRGWRTRLLLACQHYGAVVIAAHYRGSVARRRFTLQRACAERIQAAFRCHAASAHYAQCRLAAVAIQCAARASVARHAARQHWAARAFQAAFRGHVVRCTANLDTSAATAIAAAYRGFCARMSFLHVRFAVVSIQAAARGYIARRGASHEAVAATLIAAAVRGHIARTRYIDFGCAIIAMQAAVRGRATRAALASADAAVAIVQATFRARVHRAAFVATAAAAVKVQGAFRDFRMRRLSATYTTSTVTVQRWFRTVRARLAFARAVAGVTRVQSHFRGHQARKGVAITPLQRVARGFLARARARRAMGLVLWCQAMLRGRIARRRNRRRVREARARVQAANDRAAADSTLTLGYRTSKALEVVLGSKQLTEILHACITLEVSTRLSRKCCENFAFTSAAPVIIALLRSCNRSKPHQQLVRVALRILLNVAQHKDTVQAVCDACESVDVLVDLLQMFRDIDDISTPTLKLLLLLAHVPSMASAMCAESGIVTRLASMHNIFRRKLAMKERSGRARIKVAAAAGRAVAMTKSPDEERMVRGLATLLSLLRDSEAADE